MQHPWMCSVLFRKYAGSLVLSSETVEQRNLPGGHSSYREQLWNSNFLAALTSGGDGWCSQAQVHGHLRSHGQQVVLKSLLHQTLLLFSQTGHFPFWTFTSTCLQLFSQLLQGGGSGQTCNLLLTKSQRHGGSCCHNGGRQILWNRQVDMSSFQTNTEQPQTAVERRSWFPVLLFVD